MAGTLLFLVSLYLVGSAWNSGNVYALLFAGLGLLLLVALVGTAQLQAFRFAAMQVLWEGLRPLYARLPDAEQVFYTGRHRPLYFFRFHLRLRGVLRAGRDATLYFFTEGAASAGGEIHVPFFFPVAGELDVRGQLYVRDTFGLVRAAVGDESRRRLAVRAPYFPVDAPERYASLFSPDAQQRRQSSEEEKFYMREYVPGDRLKDVNWKASVRVSELITRIAPQSPEHSELVYIELRPFRVRAADDVQSVMHLNYAKSWLLSFIRAVRARYASFEFEVATGAQTEQLKSDRDIENFARTLAFLAYMDERAAAAAPTPRRPTSGAHRERFVFSTPYDEGLARHLAANPSADFVIFRTAADTRLAPRRVSFFSELRPDLLPGLWFFRRANSARKLDRRLPAARARIFEEALRIKRF